MPVHFFITLIRIFIVDTIAATSGDIKAQPWKLAFLFCFLVLRKKFPFQDGGQKYVLYLKFFRFSEPILKYLRWC